MSQIKLLLPTFSFLIPILFFTLSLKSQWILEVDLHTDGLFNYISVVDSGTVWTVGETWSGDSSLIFRRTPGGVWKRIPTNSIEHNHSLVCIAGIDSMTAFVGTGWGITSYSYLYKTTNAGVNWSAQITLEGNRGYFNDIKFSKKNPAYGFAWCDPPKGNGTPMKIYKTTNYGTNWIEYSVTLDTNYVGFASSMCVTDSLHAWFGLFRNISGPQTTGKVLYTTNGGLNFLVTTIPVLGESVGTLEFKQNNSFGLATLSYQYNYYFKSTNGGITWSAQYSPYGFGSATRVISIPNTNVWYVSTNYSGPANRLFKSTNDGLNWSTMLEPPQQFTIMYMDGVSSDKDVVIYGIGLSGEIIRLKDTATVIGLSILSSEIPSGYRLYQNYPNPFNPNTKIQFDIPKSLFINIKIFDVLGREVTQLVNEHLKPGSYEANWDASLYTSGVYFYKISSDDFIQTRRMMLLK